MYTKDILNKIWNVKYMISSRKDRWMDGWTDGRMDVCAHMYCNHTYAYVCIDIYT